MMNAGSLLKSRKNLIDFKSQGSNRFTITKKLDIVVICERFFSTFKSVCAINRANVTIPG